MHLNFQSFLTGLAVENMKKVLLSVERENHAAYISIVGVNPSTAILAVCSFP